MKVDNRSELIAEILRLKEEKNAVIMAHYYVDNDLQDIADFVGDSLALAQKAEEADGDIIVVCGVHFMGETAKILCPDKKVLVPDLEAGCSLSDSCPADEFEKFIKANPGHTVLSYANTSAAVKALTDIVVTSGNARKIVEQLPADAKIIFGPDRNLGNYINSVTGRNMLLWDGACHVHEKFSLEEILRLKKENPGAEVLVHPECRPQVRMIADKVGSTAVLLKHAIQSPATTFIVVTESGILHQMQKECPEKTFIPAPPEDEKCACNECSFMKMNTLEKLRDCLKNESPEIHVDRKLAEKARRPIDKMLEMSK